MATAAAARMRRMRERKKAAAAASPILFERSDWQLFCDPRTLPQKAGCEPGQIGRVMLKEIVDNALDDADEVSLDGDDSSCVVTDNGPGIDPAESPRLFAINRPLVSSKLKRLPTRGMLGNGLRVVMGAVAAFHGTITVTTHGRCYDLVPNTVTGLTEVRASRPAPEVRGTVVELHFPRPLFSDEEFDFAQKAIAAAGHG